MGVGNTTAWKLCTLAAGTSLAVVYDIVAAHGGGGGDPMAAQQFFLQFVTRYLHDSGAMRCRVTTITRRWGGAWHACALGLGQQEPTELGGAPPDAWPAEKRIPL